MPVDPHVSVSASEPTPTPIETERLLLVPGTIEHASAEAADATRLFALLGLSTAPEFWPPEFNDADTVAFVRDRLSEHPDHVGWWAWYWLIKPQTSPSAPAHSTAPMLIGNGGFKGPPNAAGEVEIGYSILPAWRRQGLASEGVNALCAWARRHGGATVAIIDTLPELTGSIGVARKCGFVGPEPGPEPGVIRFRRRLA